MFKKAYRFDDQTIFYFDEYDNKYVAEGGSLSWRLNNPGLLHTHEPFVHKFNTIGAQHPFVIFPSAQIGSYVLTEWLKSSRFIKERLIAVAKYYQPQAPNEFLQKLCLLAELPPDTEIKALSRKEIHRLAHAVQLLCEFSAQQEGELFLLPKICKETTIVKFAAKFFELLIQLSEQDPYKPPVIVFVHSQGAIIADLALDLLSQIDRKRIRIFAFGGGSLIAPGKAHDETHNYISEADIIPRIGSIQLAQLIIRRYEKQKQGLSEEEIIDCLISEDADYYLETTEPKALAAFYLARKKFYHKETSRKNSAL